MTTDAMTTAMNLPLPLALLLDTTVKGSLLVLLLLAATRLIRRAPAATRHLVWSAGLVAFVILPVASIALPWKWQMTRAVHVGTLPEPAGSLTGMRGTTMDGGASAQPEGATATDAPAGAPWGALLLFAWMVGAGLFGARLAVQWHATRRVVRAAAPLDSAGWNQALAFAAQRLRVDQPVRLACSERASMAFTAGVLRPTIVLPAACDSWTGDRRHAVLMHEMAHVRRRDVAMHLLARAACAMHWFNPLAWVMARRLRIEAERACDDRVVLLGTPSSDYAAHLLELVRSAGVLAVPAAAVPMARESELEERVVAILEPASQRHVPGRRAVAGVVVAVAILAAPLAVVGVFGQAEEAFGQLPLVATESRSAALTDALAAALRDPDPEVRVAASLAIGEWKDSTAVDELIRVVGADDDPDVRVGAAWALGEIGDRRAIDGLARAAQDADALVRRAALWAIREIGEKR